MNPPQEQVKPISQEPTKEERAAARGDNAPPTTAADWAREQRQKEGQATGELSPGLPNAVQQQGAPATNGQGLSVGFGSPAVDAPGGLASASAPPKHLLEISGYAILNASWSQQDAQFLYVGRNNGFALGDARIEITARPAEPLWLFLSIDGAVASFTNPQDHTQGTRNVALKDAYGIWSPGNHLRVQAGQFKAPQSVEELLEETDIKFASRSVLSTGVDVPFGYQADPMSIDRQLGIGVGTDRVPLGPGGLTAQVAVMNGNGPDQLYNDSPYPSAAARAAYDVAGISVGVYGTFQPRQRGMQPLVYRDNVFGGGADVLVNRGPLHVLILGEWRHTRHVTSQQPDETGLGFSGEAAWRFGFIEPAARVSYLNSSDAVPNGSVLWTTVGVNFYVPGAPGRLTLDFTHRGEESGRELSNDGLDLSAQVRF
jgi:hypothetical protein